MKLFVIAEGTEGYKIQWPHVVSATVSREIVAEQGRSKEPNTTWYVDDPVMAHNEGRVKMGSTVSHTTIGDEMTQKGYSTVVHVDRNGKEHVLFVPFNKVKVLC